ncbi:MAG: DUF3368 domain-containing protein [Candidatus Jordarchaeaceae archaeon]
MTALVFNATPLIYLSKVSLVENIKELPENKYLPRSVYEEVVTRGKELGSADAFKVDKLIKEGVIEIKSPSDDRFTKHLLENPKIHFADAEVLSLAKELHAIALMDDEESQAMADLEKIPNHGTIYLLFRFLNRAIISKKEFIDKLNEIIKEGWRCSTELYTKIIQVLNSF